MGTGAPTARTFCLGREDHTLGNALRHVLLASDPQNVEFAGYSVPHPSEPVVQIRVQTTSSSADPSDSNTITASAALKRACATLREQCGTVRERLEEALPYVREDRLHVEQMLLEQQRMDEEEDEEEDDDEMDTS